LSLVAADAKVCFAAAAARFSLFSVAGWRMVLADSPAGKGAVVGVAVAGADTACIAACCSSCVAAFCSLTLLWLPAVCSCVVAVAGFAAADAVDTAVEAAATSAADVAIGAVVIDVNEDE
jgi:hypothetical protein